MSSTHTARLMDGSSLARRIIDHATARAVAVERQTGTPPCLATVLVGDDPASITYVRMKRARCEKAGIRSRHHPMPVTTTTEQLVHTITGLSQDPAVHGILLQHPTPGHIDERAAFEAIAPAKDVDGVTMHSFAAMSFGLPGFTSCTPGGIIRLLDEYHVDLTGKHAVVVGRSIDKGHDVSHEFVEPVGPPGPRPGLRGVTALVRCDHPVTGREQRPGRADPRLRTLREAVQEHDCLRVHRPLVQHREPHAVAGERFHNVDATLLRFGNVGWLRSGDVRSPPSHSTAHPAPPG